MSDKKIIEIKGGKKKSKELVIPEITLNEEELKLKEEFESFDKKIDSIYKVVNSLEMGKNEDSLLVEEVLDNLIGVASVSLLSDIVNKYLGVDEDNKFI